MDFNEFKEQFTEDVKQGLADVGIEAEATEKGSVLDELKAKKEEVAQQPKKEAVEKAVKSKGSKGEEL